MKENQFFWQDVASCSELKGNDLRVIMFCYKHDRMQKDMLHGLGIKKSNASTICTKLVRMGLLNLENQYGVNFYRTNTAWTNNQVPGQMVITDIK